MKIAAVLLASIIALVPSVMGAASTNIRAIAPAGSLDHNALHQCLNAYRTDNWDGMDCGGRGWFKGTHNYRSPQNCYDACVAGISAAIDSNASDVRCDDQEGGADCWMGYH
ncbi:hypothetical protein QCA50_007035 [Cerrena zonata]|uniref:Uncharacterized protein n=1 Tax=Cerrena zonata TaxID=2478898 RepID=A0AAW0GFD1_9APHY